MGVGAIRRGPAFVRAGSFTTLGFVSLSIGGLLDTAWHRVLGTEKAVEALVALRTWSSSPACSSC